MEFRRSQQRQQEYGQRLFSAAYFTDTGVFFVSLVVYLEGVADTLYDSVHIIAPPQFELGPDVELCQPQNDTLVLGEDGWNGNYWWSTGSTDTSITIPAQDLSPDVPHEYWLIVENVCGADSDTVVVTVSNYLNVSLGSDTTVCDDFYVIDPVIENENSHTLYQWSSNETTRGITIPSGSIETHSIERSLIVSNACGTDSAGISVTFLAELEDVLPNDSTYCLDQPFYLLNPQAEGIEYLWDDSTTGPLRRIDSSGTYTLWSYNACDTLQEEVTITFNGQPRIDLGSDTALCPGDELWLRNIDSSASPLQTIVWSTGLDDSVMIVTDSGLYYAVVTLNLCKTSDSIHVFVKDYCPERCKPGISNIITPNGDGVNDALYISLRCKATGLQLFVYNRWGQLIYQGNANTPLRSGSDSPLTMTWDGAVNGTYVVDGTYYYVLEFKDENDEHRMFRGYVDVIY